MTHDVTTVEETLATPITGFPEIRVVAVRTPTLPPATHTNVYLLGTGNFAVVDPASPYPEEQARLLAAIELLCDAGETAAEILLTHHHVDHVSGARALSDAFALPIAAHRKTADKLEGRIRVDRLIEEGEKLAYGSRTFTALLTPGHAPGHLCFHDAETRAIIAGDMIASIGTIVIEPDDDGDMIQYLASLERLRALSPSVLLPSHGAPIFDADARLAFYLRHRLDREARVLAALDQTPRSLEVLVPLAYPDVAPQIFPLAARSLEAHLRKLEQEGRARRADGGWTLP